MSQKSSMTKVCLKVSRQLNLTSPLVLESLSNSLGMLVERFTRERRVSVVDYLNSKRIEDEGMSKMIAKYNNYKKKYMKNMKFDPNSSGLSKLFQKIINK